MPSFQKELAQYTKELHHRAQKRFPARKVYSNGKNDIWASDLNVMTKYERENKGYKYILVAMDIYTRRAWAFPLMDKFGKTIIECFKKLFKRYGTPRHLWSDRGSEYYNEEMQKFLEKHKVRQYSVYGQSKSCMVERVNQSLKQIMFKELTLKQTYVWWDILDDVLHTYNNRKHSVIKMTPYEAWEHPEKIKKIEEEEEQKQIEEKMAKRRGKADIDEEKDDKPRFKLGDYVRVSTKKMTFEKGYEQSYSAEVFRIVRIEMTQPITYYLNDLLAEPVEGGFYAEELLKTKLKDFALIEEVLKEKKEKNKKMYLVKWAGYGKRFNQWVDEKTVKNLYV